MRLRRWFSIACALLALTAAPVVAQPLLVTSATLQNAATTAVNGNNLDTSQMSTAVIQITPNGQITTYQLVFEASLDGTTFSVVTCYPQGSATGATSITTTWSVANSAQDRAIYRCNVAGYLLFRTRIASITATGSMSLTVKAAAYQSPFSLGGVTY